ncbi:MAG: YIP1 family protein [Dehalococcoidia bacterium]
MTSGTEPRPLRRDLIGRMLGAALLHRPTYEDVEHDTSATGQALLAVVVVALAVALGGIWLGLEPAGVAWRAVSAVLVWGAAAFVTYWVGTRVFPEPQTEADWGQLLRTLAFAQSPSVLLLFLAVPAVGPFLGLASFFWQLATVALAVRVALDYERLWRVVAVVVVWFVVNLVLSGILFSLTA